MGFTLLDYILFGLVAIALVFAFIRGLKHPQSRLEGDLFAFALAFILSIVLHGFSIGRFADPYAWEKGVADLLGADFKTLAPMIMASALFVLLLLLFIPLFRFLYRKNGMKRASTLFFTLFAYLAFAYLLGFVLSATCVLLGNADLQAWYDKSVVASKIYPTDSLMAWITNIAKGEIN
jgi:hypothetical protein